MRGLLADVNVGGHLPSLRRLLNELGLLAILNELSVEFATFPEVQVLPNIDDRSLWARCQELGWVLLTENRNDDGPDSLERTLADSWRVGDLPVITLGNKTRFERDRHYALRAAADVAELLFGIAAGEYCDRPRTYVPR